MAHSPLRNAHRPLAALNHSLSDPTLSGLMSPSSTGNISNGNGNNNSNNNPLSPSLQSIGGSQSSALAADPLSLTLRSSMDIPVVRASSRDGNAPHSVVPWTIADRTSQTAKRAARSAAFPLRYTSSYIDQNATEKGNSYPCITMSMCSSPHCICVCMIVYV